jgi:hypothetical protein
MRRLPVTDVASVAMTFSGSHGPNLLRKGVPIDVVAQRLGHDPMTLLRAYAKPLDTDSQTVREALEAMLPAEGNGAAGRG